MFSLLTNLCSEKTIRLYILDHIEILLDDLEGNSKECQVNLLGLLINLTSDKCNALQAISKKVTSLERRRIPREYFDRLACRNNDH